MQALSTDEEHARMVIKAQEKARRDGIEEKKPSGPPLSTWSPEVAMLANVADELRALRYLTTAVNSKNKPNPPMPYARPITAFDRVRNQEREAAHRALVARVLPHKAKQQQST
jgi:hypothetical protein